MVNVIATIEVVEGALKNYIKEFQLVRPLVLAEKGCVQYEVCIYNTTFNSLPTLVKANTVVIMEKWETLNDLDAHVKAEHMKQYREATKNLVSQRTLQVLSPV